MALSSQEHQKALDHINRKWSTKLCPMCGVNNWAMHGLLQLVLTEKGAPAFLHVGPNTVVLPTAAMICQNCGNTVLVNLMIAGAL